MEKCTEAKQDKNTFFSGYKLLENTKRKDKLQATLLNVEESTIAPFSAADLVAVLSNEGHIACEIKLEALESIVAIQLLLIKQIKANHNEELHPFLNEWLKEYSEKKDE